MEVCNAYPKASTTAALYEGNTAKGILRALEEGFLIVEKYTVLAEVTKFNSMKITSNQFGVELRGSEHGSWQVRYGISTLFRTE